MPGKRLAARAGGGRAGWTRPRLRRVIRAAVAGTLALLGSGALAWGPGTSPAEADPLVAPVVLKMQGAADRIDNIVDELRADFVLMVPHGYVDPSTGALQAVDGKQLRIGYDYDSTGSSKRSMRYLNTFGAAGARAWAFNQDEFFTIHKVIASGKHDLLVISVEGDLNIADNDPRDNVIGGRPVDLNWYFGYATGAPTTSTAWIRGALTVHPAEYRIYQSRAAGAGYVSGPMIQMQYDAVYNLWSNRQANWGQVLDYGLNGRPEGVLPPNSVAIDLVNFAYNSVGGGTSRGPAGSVSDSFWYAWVHEDDSLVSSINTAPIHITGVPPSPGYHSSSGQVAKNAPTNAWTLARTLEQEAQGLTARVGADGAVDFTDAGGTGYYRLAAWPESRDPNTVTNPSASTQAPSLVYTAADLFDAEGRMTEAAAESMWTPSTVFYGYDVARPAAPVVTSPVHGSFTSDRDRVVIAGTGVPGATVTLKWDAVEAITDLDAAGLTTLVDGDHPGIVDTDAVVGADGTWRTEYAPPSPLAEGPYTVVALQTEHASGFELTSDPSNPDDPDSPNRWGVTFTVDTEALAAPVFDCPASPTTETRPTFAGTGVESGAAVRVYRGETLLGEAGVTGPDWSYTVDEALADGAYTFTAAQVDRAGNESPHSAPTCALRVASDVRVDGTPEVADVEHGDPQLPAADPDNWEIVADGADGAPTVLNGGAELARGKSYTISERLRTDPAPAANAGRYAPEGDVACVDGEGAALPRQTFDPSTATLSLGVSDEIVEPIDCRVTNRTAHVTLVTHRVGGLTEAPAAGWGLRATSDEAQGFSLGLGAASVEALPAVYELAARAPEGFSVAAVERLELETPVCAAAANDPATAAPGCWKRIGGDTASGRVEQGRHSVLRVVAASPADAPVLPFTGGLGSHQFLVAAAGAFALAILGASLKDRCSGAIGLIPLDPHLSPGTPSERTQ